MGSSTGMMPLSGFRVSVLVLLALGLVCSLCPPGTEAGSPDPSVPSIGTAISGTKPHLIHANANPNAGQVPVPLPTKGVRGSSTSTPGVQQNTCGDRTTNCVAWGTQYCTGYTWQGLSVGDYWCPLTCRRCTGGGGGGGGSACNNQCDVNRALLSLVNNYRAQNGRRALCLNNKLIAAAQVHSNDMSRRNSMSHTGSDGSNPGDRMRRAGFAVGGWAENVANGQTSVQAVFNAWVNSEGHRNNILGSYTFMGAYRTGNFWTQVFATSGSEACNN